MLNFQMLNDQLGLFKVGSDESSMEVAFLCSGVFHLLPSFGDSSQALYLSFFIVSPKFQQQKKSVSG